MSGELLAQAACDAMFEDFLRLVAVTKGANADLTILAEHSNTEMDQLLSHREELRHQIGELGSSGFMPSRNVVFPKYTQLETT